MKLKEFRQKMGITQKKISDDLKINRVTYNRYELNKMEPDIKTLIKLAEYFHVSIDELVGKEHENYIDKGLLNELEIDIINRLQELDRDNQLRLQSYVYSLWQNQQDEKEKEKEIKGIIYGKRQ